MPDISLCSTKKFLKKCKTCYRLKAKPREWQSFSDFYDACKDKKYEYYMPLPKIKYKPEIW